MDEQIKDVEMTEETEVGTYEVYEPETESFKVPDWVWKAGGTAIAVAGGVAYAKRETLKAKVNEFKDKRKAKKVQKHLEALNKLGYKAENGEETK